jgi:hypothetical protein
MTSLAFIDDLLFRLARARHARDETRRDRQPRQSPACVVEAVADHQHRAPSACSAAMRAILSAGVIAASGRAI